MIPFPRSRRWKCRQFLAATAVAFAALINTVSAEADVHKPNGSGSRIEGDVVFAAPELLIVREASGERNIELDKKTSAEYQGRPLPLTELRVGDRVAVTAQKKKKSLRASRVEVVGSPAAVTRSTNSRAVVGTLLEIDRYDRTFTIATGPSSRVIVDVRAANDASGRHVNLDDFRAGDRLFVQVGNGSRGVPVAQLVRFADHRESEARSWTTD